MKTLSIVNNAALPANVEVRLNSLTGSGNVVRRDVGRTLDASVEFAFFVLQPGDVLSAITTQASAIIAGFGAELEGTAD